MGFPLHLQHAVYRSGMLCLQAIRSLPPKQSGMLGLMIIPRILWSGVVLSYLSYIVTDKYNKSRTRF